MYFQIENTPEHIRKSRRVKTVQPPPEECPRLILAPFSRPPQVVFDNVVIGSSCERNLEVVNPSKQTQQITLGKALPPGLIIHLPEEWLEVEPESCYSLVMVWTPTQPTATRETLRFTNENRGRYDVNVVLKSVMNIKGKNKPKTFKTSPGKIRKKTAVKKSPVAIYKKKAEIIYNATKVETVNVVQTTQHNVYQTYYNKENILQDDQTINMDIKCPFDSPFSNDSYFNTSEIPQNVLKASNRQNCDASDIFDNLTFTPLKSLPAKTEKLNKGPQIVFSVNSDSEFEESSMNTYNKENQTHSIISITATQPPNKWLTVNHIENQFIETPTIQNKKHPNTSSPKEMNSPNFSINTEFSRISDLSFFPQRFSTERKCFPKNDTHDILDDKVNSDTFTKDSPVEHNFHHRNTERPPHFFNREQSKKSLFREYHMQQEAYDRNDLNPYYEPNTWHTDRKANVRSPTRSITPPLQSIPEESTQYSTTQTDKQMATFTLDRTFDKHQERNSLSTSSRQTWSKKAIRVEPDLWKVPVSVPVRKSTKTIGGAPKSKDSIGGGISNATFEANKSTNQNITINTIGNVYSQSSTVDPFLSSTYFYDEEAVAKFEKEFKRWLNCILTPPADLDSNVDQKIDVGKAWIENRNKEVPLAPTKEQVCSTYHNSLRLQSLRRTARNLLKAPEMEQVFQKLKAQIEKKLIAIRTDRNLHLDVGLQKAILELLLSYNPLWLRIGLEAIYGLVLPLKSNSDIEGLTTFIVQRLFKNPRLKNKHSKSSAPNMLLPAYMEAIKKFTLEKFFKLVYFLDQAKQKKLIAHDPCLFCRNAICKESREIIIRFTRELIAGIGDITRHLRPLGYVVCQKQSYLDEYKYAVNNLALDIRDGVRLSKVMEIILIKNGLLNQLRTPAISRLQKIHNVQVAFNALKEANFVIVGDITATDIADGHREKTLSLLWQLIHVFRAPLFEKAANVIQTWWRKKFEVIAEKRREEQRVLLRLSNAASVLQCWWRRIQYNRQVECRMQQVTRATIMLQKNCRMWLCRSRFRKYKTSVLKIEGWFKSIQLIREAQNTLQEKRIQRERLRHDSATKIQSYFRMIQQRRVYLRLKKSVQVVEDRYIAMIKMRIERNNYLHIQRTVIKLQALYRGKRCREEYLKKRNLVILLQRRFRAQCLMKKCSTDFLKKKKSVLVLQKYTRSYLTMKKLRQTYVTQRTSALLIQRHFRSYRLGKSQRHAYANLRNAAIVVQIHYRSLVLMRKERNVFLRLKTAAICIQRQYRAQIEMRKCRSSFIKLQEAALAIQARFRAIIKMREQSSRYNKLRGSCIKIQKSYRAYVIGKQQRRNFIKQKEAALKIQKWYRNCKKGKEVKDKYEKSKEACVTIQRHYKAYIIGRQVRKEFIKIRTATICIQKFYRSYIETKTVRQEFIKMKMSTVIIQKFYRSYLETKKQRETYLKIKSAVICIENVYRQFKQYQKTRQSYLQLRRVTIYVQRRFRSVIAMRQQRNGYLEIKRSILIIQQKYRAIISMRVERESYLGLQSAAINVQTRYRALRSMRQERMRYITTRKACVCIQRSYKAYILRKRERQRFLMLKQSTIVVQRRYRALLAMRKQRTAYLMQKTAAITIQRQLRANNLMIKDRTEYAKKLAACKTIQIAFRAYLSGKKQRAEYMKMKTSAIIIQTCFRMLIETRRVRTQYLQLRSSVIMIQRRYREKRLIDFIRQSIAAKRIQIWYRSIKERDACRREYLNELTKRREDKAAVILQKNVRRYLIQTWYRRYRQKVLSVQRIYRGKLMTNVVRAEYLQKKSLIVNIQSVARGYLVRRKVAMKKADIIKTKEEQKQNRAATKIQALFRGNKARVAMSHDHRVTELRRRWREGALHSTQESIKERYEEAMHILYNFDMHAVLVAFKSIELITEVYPMMFKKTATRVGKAVTVYLHAVNRSLSSVELISAAAAIFVNLARYRVTGPNVYSRESVLDILRLMLRFSSSTRMFCIMSTFLWLFSKYDGPRQDLTEFFRMPEYHKMLVSIKSNVERSRRMAINARNKFNVPHYPLANANNSINIREKCIMPALEPGYGIVRVGKPQYFEDSLHAINSIFQTYNL